MNLDIKVQVSKTYPLVTMIHDTKDLICMTDANLAFHNPNIVYAYIDKNILIIW